MILLETLLPIIYYYGFYWCAFPLYINTSSLHSSMKHCWKLFLNRFQSCVLLLVERSPLWALVIIPSYCWKLAMPCQYRSESTISEYLKIILIVRPSIRSSLALCFRLHKYYCVVFFLPRDYSRASFVKCNKLVDVTFIYSSIICAWSLPLFFLLNKTNLFCLPTKHHINNRPPQWLTDLCAVGVIGSTENQATSVLFSSDITWNIYKVRKRCPETARMGGRVEIGRAVS